MLQRSTRVFVSSTLDDLAEFPNAVRDATFRADAILFEDQAATGRPAANVVKEEVDRSDAALLLVGHRW